MSRQVRGKIMLFPSKCEGFAVVTTPFSVFQTVHKKQGCYSVKNTVAERGDDRVFGVSEHPQETGL